MDEGEKRRLRVGGEVKKEGWGVRGRRGLGGLAGGGLGE